MHRVIDPALRSPHGNEQQDTHGLAYRDRTTRKHQSDRPDAVRFFPRGFTIIELMVVVLITSFLAMAAITAYGRYRARSHHAETNLNLKGIFVAETAYFAEQHRYNNFTAIGFKLVSPTNRYTYRSEGTDDAGNGTGVIETIPSQIGALTPDNTILPAASSATGFTATSSANIDTDATIDQWHVSDWPPVAGSNDTNDVTY